MTILFPHLEITIADGETTGSVTLTIVDDNVAGGEEIGILSLINPSGGLSLGTTTTSNITITDDDSSPSLDLDANDDNTVDGKFQRYFLAEFSAVFP